MFIKLATEADVINKLWSSETTPTTPGFWLQFFTTLVEGGKE